MEKKVVIEYFKGTQKVADMVGISHAAVSKWPNILTDKIFHRIIGAAAVNGISVPDEWLENQSTD